MVILEIFIMPAYLTNRAYCCCLQLQKGLKYLIKAWDQMGEKFNVISSSTLW